MSQQSITRRIAVAIGEAPADLTILNANVFNVFSGEFQLCDVLVSDDRVACVLAAGKTDSPTPQSSLDANGRYLVPGFIDAHVHMESSHLCPEEFTALLASHGVTSVVADPHEICNVMGEAGLKYMLEASQSSPIRVFFMLPSCVPASHLLEAAHCIRAEDLKKWLDEERVIGLGEMMNYPGLCMRDADVMAKISMIEAYNRERFGHLQGLGLDGHAPLVAGRDLQAYIAAGISSDHECSTPDEARERLEAGMDIMLREGSSARNLLDLIPALTRDTARQCMLCTDDRNVGSLTCDGSINYLVRLLARDSSLPLADVLRMAAFNTARHFGINRLGGIAPGWLADFALYPDLEHWKPDLVWCRGRLVARDGRPLCVPDKLPAANLRDTVRLSPSAGPQDLRVPDMGKAVRVMGVIPRQLISSNESHVLPARDGSLHSDPERDILKAAVFERHKGSGRVALGFVRGMGIKNGALASTVAHDAHNLIVVGSNDEDMWLAVSSLRDCGGGQVVCADGQVKALLPLPLAGLFSDAPAAGVAEQQADLHKAARALGCPQDSDPLMTLAFLSLEVIPSLKLTHAGLVDVENFCLMDLYC
ncbi:adenine deaminase [Desulfovibrio sp. OttesenSCG-928-M16]|nr:adenine deaminase [Desulfovibrio sp. OttesenSCG-928-M16]